MAKKTKHPPNVQRIPLRLFIPWDSQGRIYLDEHRFITRETEVKDNTGKILVVPEGIWLAGKR